MTGGDALILFVVMPILFGFYLMPTIIAFVRGHKNRIPILVLNFFFGWTFLGWVGTLAWSLTAKE